MKKLISILLAGALALGAMAATSCKKSGGGGETWPQELSATFDKTSYYPFDVVTVRLSGAVQGESYTGTIGGEEITAHRVADTELAFVLPDLPAGEHTLSLQIDAQAVGGTLSVVVLPTVDNPEEIITQAKDLFAASIALAQETDYLNGSVMTDLAALLDEQLASMSADERQMFAAWWQTHPELATDWEDFVESVTPTTRASLEQRMEQLLAYTLIWTATTTGLSVTLVSTVVSGGWAIKTKHPVLIGVAVASTLSMLGCWYMSDRYGQRALDCVAFQQADFFEILTGTRADTSPDFTVDNGGTLTFDVNLRYRSVAAEDVGNLKAKEIVAAGNTHTTVWIKLKSWVDELRMYTGNAISPLQKVLPEIPSITAPKTESERFTGELTLKILSGDVSAEKTGGNSFTFTTSSEQDVVFTFTLTADSIESNVFSGLVKVGDGPTKPIESVLVPGKWECEDFVLSLDPEFSRDLLHTITFTAAGTFTYNYTEWDSKSGDVVSSDPPQNGTYTIETESAKYASGKVAGLKMKEYDMDDRGKGATLHEYQIVELLVQTWYDGSLKLTLSDGEISDGTFMFDRVEE
jgi:uncharacterized protein (DUF2267 family)